MSESPFKYAKFLISLFNVKGSCHSNCHTLLQMVVLETYANIPSKFFNMLQKHYTIFSRNAASRSEGEQEEDDYVC